MPTYITPLSELGKEDTAAVGGKSANLGELARIDVPTLPGFTTTSEAYDYYVEETGIKDDIHALLDDLDPDDVDSLQETGEAIRDLIEEAEMPDELREAILQQYRAMGEDLGVDAPAVAVRSSATAEDLPGASFAGQQETFLNVAGEEDLIEAVKGCYASLFTDRAISYREDKGFAHFDVKLSCIVQKMGRSDLASSGVMFTLDPDTGFDEVVVIEAGYGLGELVVQGEINPDEYIVFKETDGIIEKKRGAKEKRMVLRDDVNTIEQVPREEREEYALRDEQIKELAGYAQVIEDHYDQPMDIEWVLDGETNDLYIVQARPETVHAVEEENVIRTYHLDEEPSRVLLEGTAIGDLIGAGTVKILDSPRDMDQFEEGDVLVTEMTDPDWEPIMKQAGAIVTDKGGKTSHAAIVSRELGVPAIVGAGHATKSLRDGEEITVDCTADTGRVYEGILDFSVDERHLDEIPRTDTEIMLILGDPDSAFNHAGLPVDGVGLAREEFIISSHVGEHPLHLIEQDEGEKYTEALKSGIAKIAAAFYPHDVIVRLSDFKSDEYRGLEGGEKYEPQEANPMLGWRGAARYYDDEFKEAFRLECEALKRVRDEVGLDNVIVMVPFCRTPEEGEQVLEIMEDYGLSQGEDLDVYVMAEIPSNIVLAEAYADIFDGFSIGSNDLTQLTLGVDRNSEKLAFLFDEDEDAVTRSISQLIHTAHDNDTKVGICGDAPSTVDGYAEFLVDQGIDSISVSPDVALETIVKVAEAER